MPTIRELLIAIRTKGDTSALDQADRRIDGTKGRAAGLGQELKRLAGGFAALAAAKKVFTELEEDAGKAALFGKSIAQIGTLIPGSAARLAELRAGIVALAEETGKPMNDLAQTVYGVISSIGDTPDVLTIAKQSAIAATAGISDLTTSMELLTGISQGFGDATKENTERISDLAFMAVNLGPKLRFADLASVGSVVPLSNMLKITKEEMFSVFATLSGITGDASMVATQYESAMMSLTKRTPEGSAALKKMGFASAEAATEQLGLVGTLRAMIATTDGSSESVMKLFHRQEGAQLAMALAGAQAKTFDEKLVGVTRAAKATAIAYHEATTGAGALAQAMAIQKVQAEKLDIELGERMAPTVMRINTGLFALKKAFAEAFLSRQDGIANLLDALGDVDGKMGGIKSTADDVATVVVGAAGLMTLAFLGTKAVVQELLADLMMTARFMAGDQAGADAIRAQKGKDLGDTGRQIDAVTAELGRSPEESRAFRAKRNHERAVAEFGLQGAPGLPLGLSGEGEGAMVRGGRYGYGAGPFRANLPGVEGQAARAEIQQLVINVGNKTVAESTQIVKDGVGRAWATAAQQMIPGFHGAGAQLVE